MADAEFIKLIIKLLIFFPLILILIYASLKYGGKKFGNFKSSKIIKVLERVPLTKESTIVAVKVGSKGLIFISSPNKTDVLMELDEKQLQIYEDEIDALNKQRLNQYTDFIEKLKEKSISGLGLIKKTKDRITHKRKE